METVFGWYDTDYDKKLKSFLQQLKIQKKC